MGSSGAALNNLDIILITFNRRDFLEKTLKTLFSSPFRGCNLWLLNNASTDDTLQVCYFWQSQFPHCTLVTHTFNIGGNANILRAYEYGNAEYKWILCDDDDLQFEPIEDLLETIQESKYDLIRISDAEIEKKERGQANTLSEILEGKNQSSFLSFSFVPGVIFRANPIALTMNRAYHHIYTSYPQLFVLFGAFELSASVYTTRQAVVVRGVNTNGTGCEVYRYWFLATRAIRSTLGQKKAISTIIRRKTILGLGIAITRDKLNGRRFENLFFAWRSIYQSAPNWLSKLVVLLSFPFVLVPKPILQKLVSILAPEKFQIWDFHQIRQNREHDES
ncbi:hypothetical protein CCP3SC1AL1_80020 [Gammaproteobacteria bacterium]